MKLTAAFVFTLCFYLVTPTESAPTKNNNAKKVVKQYRSNFKIENKSNRDRTAEIENGVRSGNTLKPKNVEKQEERAEKQLDDNNASVENDQDDEDIVDGRKKLDERTRKAKSRVQEDECDDDDDDNDSINQNLLDAFDSDPDTLIPEREWQGVKTGMSQWTRFDSKPKSGRSGTLMKSKNTGRAYSDRIFGIGFS